MTLNKTKTKDKFIELVKKSNNIAISCHYSPDDDAIGSILATYSWLVKKYPKKSIRMIVTGNRVERFSSFYNYEKIQFVNDISTELDDIDLLIMQDGSQYSRFTRSPDSIATHSCTKVCFDHHSSPVDKFDLIYLDKNATSASEIIMDVLYKTSEITKDIALMFMLGIMGDTGTFSYLKPNQIKTFDNIKTLLKISKIEIQEFKSSYSQISQKAFVIIQEYIKNTTFVDLPENSYQYSYITQDYIDKNSISDSETSEAGHIYMAQYIRNIDKYRWGFIATPKRDEISVSFRSLPRSVNVRILAENLKMGGGHDRAGGISFKPERWGKKLNLNFAIKYLIDWISSNKLELS